MPVAGWDFFAAQTAGATILAEEGDNLPGMDRRCTDGLWLASVSTAARPCASALGQKIAVVLTHLDGAGINGPVKAPAG